MKTPHNFNKIEEIQVTANVHVVIKHGNLIYRSQIGYQITIPENFHPNQKFTQRKNALGK